MTASTAEISDELPCHGCGYDLRAHPADGKCPECGELVELSRKMALIPRRPLWRDADPRWRRRMVAGVWVLTLMPLMAVLKALHLDWELPMPSVFGNVGRGMLKDTLIWQPGVYEPLIFCIGVVLLFSKERDRRAGQLDWTRPWGIICSYVVSILSAAAMLYLVALVMAGISALLISMPLRFHPPLTQFFVELSTFYLRHVGSPTTRGMLSLVAFSSITMLLACAPLFNALRSSGSKRFAIALLIPLALFAGIHLGQVGLQIARSSGVRLPDVVNYQVYFWPDGAAGRLFGYRFVFFVEGFFPFAAEIAKWCIILTIAIWLSIAQFSASRQRESGPKSHVD